MQRASTAAHSPSRSSSRPCRRLRRWPDAVFDVAVPGDHDSRGPSCVCRLDAPVLIQKPMGEDLDDGTHDSRALCRERRLAAAMNFQLRFSPNVPALRDRSIAGQLGELRDIEVRVVDRQPWEQWSFLKGAPRLESALSLHPLPGHDSRDRSESRDRSTAARSRTRSSRGFADTRSTIILDYGDRDRAVRCTLEPRAIVTIRRIARRC